MLADAAQLAATERTACWLDQLTAHGHLTPEQRAKIAAEDGAPSLARVLRRVELAGLDPHQTLRDAVAGKPLTGATNTTNVIYSRITDHNTRRYDPVGDRWADWAPITESPEWNTYLHALAAAADQRAHELGAQAAADAPEWAREAFGPVPTEDTARQEWERRAGTVAAYRELRGHTDPDDALGRAPTGGQVEAYASYRAAWRALGRPEIDRAEDEMTDGAHRVRIRAWHREQAIAPRYVGNELAGTRQAAAHHRTTATLRHTEAAASSEEAERARLEREARGAAALADTLDRQITVLEQLDDARAVWFAHTAVSRRNAECSEAVLSARRVDDVDPEPRVTAQEWLDTHHQALAVEEPHRAVTEYDVADADTARDLANDPDRDTEAAAQVEDVIEPDLREIAVREPRPRHEDVVRVADPDELRDNVTRSRRALAEITARHAYDQHAEEEHRVEQLGRWHAEDEQDYITADTNSDSDEFEPAVDEAPLPYQPAAGG